MQYTAVYGCYAHVHLNNSFKRFLAGNKNTDTHKRDKYDFKRLPVQIKFEELICFETHQFVCLCVWESVSQVYILLFQNGGVHADCWFFPKNSRNQSTINLKLCLLSFFSNEYI